MEKERKERMSRKERVEVQVEKTAFVANSTEKWQISVGERQTRNNKILPVFDFLDSGILWNQLFTEQFLRHHS